MVDWGMGRYEQTAAELAPVAGHVISLADLQRGEVAVDLATGTGNAALLAARAGAVVTGLDAAARLIDVARARAAAEGVEAEFVVGDIQALPFEDDSFDVALRADIRRRRQARLRRDDACAPALRARSVFGVGSGRVVLRRNQEVRGELIRLSFHHLRIDVPLSG